MESMNNLDRLLGEKIMMESLHGGPARYRKAHLQTDPDAQCKAELRAQEAEAGAARRTLTLKLPGLRSVRIRLPGWVPAGRQTA